MKIIKTGQKRSDAKRKVSVMVDDCDFGFLSQFNWQVDKFGCVKTHGNKTQKRILIHRLLLKAPDSLEVDHIDGNRLNNQRSNLRLATSSQNKCNRGARKDCESGLKGVSWHSQREKWIARIKSPYGKYLHLGLFSDKLEAARAYDKASREQHGEFAFVNLH